MTLGSVLTACDTASLGGLTRARDGVAPGSGQTSELAEASPDPLAALGAPPLTPAPEFDPLTGLPLTGLEIPGLEIPGLELPDLQIPELPVPDLPLPDLPSDQQPLLSGPNATVPPAPVPPAPGPLTVPTLPPIPGVPPIPTLPPIPGVPPTPVTTNPPVTRLPVTPSPPVVPPTPPPVSPSPGSGSGAGSTAAERFGWGQPDRVDDFTSGLGPGWNVYNGPGHAKQGRRSPSAVGFSNGIMTITGNSEGTTAGMAWNPGAKYGRWEGRVRAPASDPSYNALLLLWPDGNNFPAGGEIDFMEMLEPTRQRTNLFLHYSAQNKQIGGKVEIDGTQWRNWAVEWTPTHIAAFVDGVEWFRTTDTSKFPPGPMHLCIQLDWFPKKINGSVRESEMHVDWVRFYAYP